jgi:hypothetical protein
MHEQEPTIDETADYITNLPGYDDYGPEGKARLLRRLGAQSLSPRSQVDPPPRLMAIEDGVVTYYDLVTGSVSLDEDDEPVAYLIVPRDEP